MSESNRRTVLRAFVLSLPFCEAAVSTARAITAKPLRIVTLGDSITKGVRPGVTDRETFASLLGEKAKQAGVDAEVINVGIGGERTDQALKRLDRDVIAKEPDIVTVMYGANDSYVDPNKTGPRLTIEEFEANLAAIVDRLQERKIRVVLMTEPRWGAKASPNGLGEHPNLRMEDFMKSVREVARRKSIPLVDHYRIWTRREAEGQDIGTITTDQLHPNPAGHRLLADSIWPTIEPILKVGR